MAKLGSEKRPVIVRVQTEEKGREIATLCAEHGWHYIVLFEPTSPEDTSDMDKLLNQLVPIKAPASPGRNDPCPCGSGKKYKRCCGK